MRRPAWLDDAIKARDLKIQTDASDTPERKAWEREQYEARKEANKHLPDQRGFTGKGKPLPWQRKL